MHYPTPFAILVDELGKNEQEKSVRVMIGLYTAVIVFKTKLQSLTAR